MYLIEFYVDPISLTLQLPNHEQTQIIKSFEKKSKT